MKTVGRKMKGKASVAPLENSPFGEDVAKRVARAGNEILKTLALTPKAFVDYSRNPKSITHKDVFHCSGEQAKEAYWIDRARKLLGCVYEINVQTNKSARVFNSILASTVTGEVRRSYRPLSEVIGDANMLGQISLDTYRTVCAACDRIESVGLEKDPAWRRIITAVRTSVPAGAR